MHWCQKKRIGSDTEIKIYLKHIIPAIDQNMIGTALSSFRGLIMGRGCRPILVNMRSAGERIALSAGTQHPICAIIVAMQVARSNVLFPAQKERLTQKLGKDRSRQAPTSESRDFMLKKNLHVANLPPILGPVSRSERAPSFLKAEAVRQSRQASWRTVTKTA